MVERFGVIPEAEPGSEQAFSRDEFIAQLDLLTSECSTPLVLALHGPWGTGKTHLLKTWQKKLDEAKRPYVYYNAWENDHGDDPFVSFVAEIHEAAAKMLRGKFVQGLVKKAAKAIPGLVPVGSKVLLSMACKMAGIDKEDLSVDDLYKALEGQIKKHTAQRKSIEGFKQELTKLAEKLGDNYSIEHPGNETPPLLVIVDELDRCRPDFAISLLERVKHILSVQGVVFLFAVDMEQLAHTAKCLYGQEMDAEGYFRRFFDATIALPEPGTMEFEEYISYKAKALVDMSTKYRFDEKVFGVVCSMLKTTLREAHQILSMAQIVTMTMARSDIMDDVLLILSLKIKRTKTYESIKSKEYDDAVLKDIFRDGLMHKSTRKSNIQIAKIGGGVVRMMLALGTSKATLARCIQRVLGNECGDSAFGHIQIKQGNQIDDAYYNILTTEFALWRAIITRIDLLFPGARYVA